VSPLEAAPVLGWLVRLARWIAERARAARRRRREEREAPERLAREVARLSPSDVDALRRIVRGVGGGSLERSLWREARELPPNPYETDDAAER